MNGLQRIAAAMRFERPDRTPAVPQVFGHAARLAGVPLRTYLTDGDVMARCQLRAQTRYGSDAVFAFLDVNVEAEALGAKLTYPDDRYPWIERHPIERPAAAGGLRVPDPARDGRMPATLAAARLLRRELGDDVLVAGCVLGPMALALQLLGAERGLYAAVDDADAFDQLLDFAAEVALRFGAAQLEAGAHLCVVFDPAASPAVVPPAFFRDRLAGRLRRMLDGLGRAGSLASWLHIPGPVEPILPSYAECSATLANIDWPVDPDLARAAAPGLCLDGNVRCMAFVDSEPEAVAAACARAIDRAGARGFILSSGCEIPLEARPECIDALVASARTCVA